MVCCCSCLRLSTQQCIERFWEARKVELVVMATLVDGKSYNFHNAGHELAQRFIPDPHEMSEATGLVFASQGSSRLNGRVTM